MSGKTRERTSVPAKTGAGGSHRTGAMRVGVDGGFCWTIRSDDFVPTLPLIKGDRSFVSAIMTEFVTDIVQSRRHSRQP